MTMLGINKHSLAAVAVAVGVLASAGSANAGTPPIIYNGHAGLGVTDGTSNTIMFGAIASDGRGVDPILMADMGPVRSPPSACRR